LNQTQRLAESDRLVFYTQLREYRVDEESESHTPALDWLESEWRAQTGEGARPLLDFMKQGSLTLLLDGLNEIPRSSPEEYGARVGEWRNLVNSVDRDYPGTRLLFACRPMDYSARLDEGRHGSLPEIEV